MQYLPEEVRYCPLMNCILCHYVVITECSSLCICRCNFVVRQIVDYFLFAWTVLVMSLLTQLPMCQSNKGSVRRS